MYLTGTAAASAVAAKDFMELVLHPNLLTAGFTYVEQTGSTARVYKSAAAANGVGDWYLITGRSADAGSFVAFSVGEEYDVAGHLIKKWAPASTVAGQTLPADRSHYTTAGTSPVTALNLAGAAISVSVSAGGQAYILSLHPKRVVAVCAAGGAGVYAGLYEPILPVAADHFPLMVAAISNASGAVKTSYSREPGTGTSVATSSGDGTFTAASGAALWAVAADIAASDLYALKPGVCQMYVPPSQSKVGAFRGIPYGLYAADRGTMVWGDTVNIDWAGETVVATPIWVEAINNRNRLVDQAY